MITELARKARRRSRQNAMEGHAPLIDWGLADREFRRRLEMSLYRRN